MKISDGYKYPWLLQFSLDKKPSICYVFSFVSPPFHFLIIFLAKNAALFSFGNVRTNRQAKQWTSVRIIGPYLQLLISLNYA